MGAISERYAQLGGVRGPLGRATEREHVARDRVGHLRCYEGGLIAWHPKLGAHAVIGAIADKWSKLGGEGGFLGYPVCEEALAPGGGLSRFEGGMIYRIGTRILITDLSAEAQAMHAAELSAKPLPGDWVTHIPHDPLPPKVVDYTSDINFARNQIPHGGCMTYALLHVMDILKDWEHPYTPALSFRYVDWYRIDWLLKHGGEHGWQFRQPFAYGVAPEGLCHTDFDHEYDAAANAAGQMPWPPPSAEAQAVHVYRVEVSEPYLVKQPEPGQTMSPSIDEIKYLLRRYGPVWIEGCGHATAIVGYDDTQSLFKVLDSIVDMTSGNNVVHLAPYDQLHLNVYSFRKVVNVFTPERTAGPQTYSARLCIENCWRGTYTVSVGVEGREPLVVWTTRGRNSDVPWEPSKVLKLDVPLPAYAADCWPPNPSHRWFLRVEDHDRDGATGTITEFTLARRYVDENCKSLGKYRSETYGGSQSVVVPDPIDGEEAPPYPSAPLLIPNPNPGVATVVIPTGSHLSPAPRLHQPRSITLQDQGKLQGTSSWPAQEALLGRLQMCRLGAWTPIKARKVTLYELEQGGCVNKPSTWLALADAVTDAEGYFSFVVPAPLPVVDIVLLGKRYYAAAYSDESGDVLASSEAVGINRSELKGMDEQMAHLQDHEYVAMADTEIHPDW